jgi:hypothetical protein
MFNCLEMLVGVIPSLVKRLTSSWLMLGLRSLLAYTPLAFALAISPVSLGRESLVLTTCWPFDAMKSGDQRYLIFADHITDNLIPI